jgi:putative transposase
VANRLVDRWRANRSLCGVEKLHAAARRAGIDIGRDQVVRLMRIAGIARVTRGRHKAVTTKGDPAAARHPDYCKRQWHVPDRPDQWWVADFERHEALLDRAVMKGYRLRVVAAAR